ncbi:hypothetical protein CesoFtcFv8_027374 [Champsocephalus esox]|uniref:Uncharacterized protein n=1 Tax=Champsocephalus esox TaxID=159716 RepID=A0AAN8AYV7_9TELE|nr:hypothetical protein CesoFtcFv8_027374 [Champsocephalus esox]
MRAFIYPTMAAGDRPEGHIIGADVYDHQSPPLEPQACRVDVCSHVQNVLLNTRHVESGSRYTGSLQAAINSY